MASRRRYTKAEKAEAVGLAAATSTEAAAEQLGIPRRTLGYWTTIPEFAELRQKTREDVVDMFWAAIQIGIDQVAIGLLGDEPLRDKSVALGILFDKHALMSGDVTSRTETVSAVEGLDADQKRELRRVFSRVAAAELAEGTAEGTRA